MVVLYHEALGRPGPDSIAARRDEPGEALVDLVPEELYRACGDADVEVDGAPIAARMAVLLRSTTTPVRVVFRGSGHLVLTPRQVREPVDVPS